MKKWKKINILAAIAVVFGLVTVFSAGRALFGDAQARASVGHAIAFVVWFNFIAGFAYVLTGIGLWQGRRWAAGAALGIAVTTGLVGLAFAALAFTGTPYEPRTAAALVLRLTFWILVVRGVWRARPGRLG